MKKYVVSTVNFDDGKRETEILACREGQADRAHLAHRSERARFWGGFKKVVGGRYQVVTDIVDAFSIENAMQKAS